MDFKEITAIIAGNSSFSLIDYIVVGISLAVVLFFAIYHGILSQPNALDFLVGGRTMGPGPISISTAMMFLSALVIIENPAEIYYRGIQSFTSTIITVAVVPISALLFVSMLHKMELISIHQYIGHRFSSSVFRCLTSMVFIIHETVYTCIMLGTISFALDKYLQVPVLTSIVGIGALTAINTTLGGFKGSVSTQVFYYVWITIFLLGITIVTASKSGGVLQAFELAAKNRRLQLVDPSFEMDPLVPHNLLNFVIGYGFITLMEITTRQPIVQRYSSTSTSRDAKRSIFMSLALYLFISLMCLLIGIFLQAAYAGCDPLTLKYIDTPDKLIPYFVKKTLSFIPGVSGFFAASILGSAISVYSVSVNSVTACFYKDFVRQSTCCKSKSDAKSYSATCCRIICLSFSVLSCALTYFAVKHSDFPVSYVNEILPLVNPTNLIIFNSVLYGPLAGVFLAGMFCPCVNKYGASAGFLGGLLGTGYLAYYKIIAASTTPITHLPPIMGECPDLNGTILFQFLPFHPQAESSTSAAETLELITRKEDFFSVSYLLLGLIGALITIILSLPISLLTGGFCSSFSQKIPVNLLHPVLSCCCCQCCVDSSQRQLQHAISHRYVDRINSVHNLFPASGGGTILNSRPPSFKYSSLPVTPDSS